MPAFTLRREDVFPVGTTVAVYPRSNWPQSQLPPSGPPVGSSVASATVAADGSAAFSLAAGAYFAYANVSGEHRYVAIRAESASGTVAAPSGAAATDTAAIQAAIDAAAGGGIVQLAAGTYTISATLTMKSGVVLRGAGRSNTVIQAATNLNAPLVKSLGFDSLTGTGNNTGGVGTFEIADLTLDGNASNQSSATTAGVAIYGYDFALRRIAIRNVRAADGLYTEWGTFGGTGLPEKAMEAVVRDVRIHDNTLTGAGWRYRGPHDAMASEVIIYQNTTNAVGFWSETQGTTVTVAAGSNGVDTATFAGAGTLNVNTTLGYPDAGTITVAGATLTYTGKTAQTFTGVTRTAGTGTLATGNTVSPAGGGYAGSAALIDRMHVWGSHSWAAILDANTKLVSCELEGGNVGQLLVRGGDCSFTGGRIFYLGANPGLGVQIGDTVNSCAGFMLNDPEMTGFAGGAAGQAAINIVGSASGQYRAKIFHSGTNQQVFGTFQPYERRQIQYAGNTTPTVVAGAGLGTSPPAAAVANASDHRGSVRMGTGTTPAAGTAAAVTWRQPKPGTPTVAVFPMNAVTAALQPYVFNMSSTGFSIGFAVAPAASQAANTYEVGYRDEG